MTDFRKIIIRAFPDLAAARFEVLTHSWDSVAVDVDDAFIFKFPRDADAETALRVEARLLDHIMPRVTLTVPDMTLHDTPPFFSRHRKIKGEHLENFESLSESAKQRLGQTLGQFYAELHSLDQETMRELGAKDLPSWGQAEDILKRCLTCLPHALHGCAAHTCTAWANLPPDPYGIVYGFQDGHGWNMAFDRDTETLNGIYDFADSGFAPLHQDFIYASLTSHDLASRIISSYEEFTRRELDRTRISILTGMHRLWELAETADGEDDVTEKIRQIEAWKQWGE